MFKSSCELLLFSIIFGAVLTQRHLKNYILIIYFILIGQLVGYCQHLPDRPGTVLWKITKQGSPFTSYLFGTQHNYTDAFFKTYPKVPALLKKADVFINESKFESKFNLDNIIYYCPVSDSLRWHHYVSKKQRRNILKFFKYKMGMGLRNWATRLIHVDYLLTQSFYKWSWPFIESIEGSTGEKLIDYSLYRQGKKYCKKIKSLENSNESMNVFRSVQYGDNQQTIEYIKKQAQFLDSAITLSNSKKINADLIKEWASPEYYNLAVNFFFDSTATSKFELIALKSRNDKWVPQLKNYLSNNNCFVAVGYGHLQYSYGLIMQLTKEGFSVEPERMK